MKVTPIDPYDDPRVEHKTAQLNGHTYHYLLAVPKHGNFHNTIFLIHGWPDLCVSWRYQIPFLADLGFRVVVPDMMGYGGTDAPQVPPEDLRLYSLKRASDDLAELARQLGADKVIIGGHDWGGVVVFRAILWHPQLFTHVFSVCTPYPAPQEEYFSNEDLVKRIPQFQYQVHFASGEIEKRVKTEEDLRQFFGGVFGGRGPNKEVALDPYVGIVFENLPKIGKPKFLSDTELKYYVEQFSRNGLHGPFNWYRTRKVNFEDDKSLPKRFVDIPTLFIQANRDIVLKPELSLNMERQIPNLTRGEVDATHWALVEKPDEVNAIVKGWLEKCGLLSKSSL